MPLASEQNSSVEQGKRLRKARKLTFLSRRAFARKHRINPSSLQAWEDGRYKKGILLKTATLLVQALERDNIYCSAEWIMRGIGSGPRKQVPQRASQITLDESSLLINAQRQRKTKQLNFQLIDAIKNNHVEACKKYISKGANLHTLVGSQLHIYDPKRDTALHLAAYHGSAQLIDLFVSLGIHPNIRNRHLDTPIHVAAHTENLLALRELVNCGASIESASREGATPLIWAAYLGNVRTCEFLLSEGANVNNADHAGNTALHWACLNDQTEVIEFLLNQGANHDIQNHENKLAIDWAVENGHLKLTKILLEQTT